MQSTKNTEWIQMDWKLRIIDKRQEWRSGQSLTFFSLVDLHIALYCIKALYDFAQCIYCIVYLFILYSFFLYLMFVFLHCTFVFSAVSLHIIFHISNFVFCIFHTVTLCNCAVCIAYFCFFCGEFAHQDWFAAKTLLKFPSCPSQPESKDIFHQNTNKTHFIEMNVQNIWTGIFKILKLTVVLNLTTGHIYGFNIMVVLGYGEGWVWRVLPTKLV